MNDLLLLPLTFAFSSLATWLFIRSSQKWHWFDVPDSRSSHTVPTPTGGGIVFSLIFVLAVCVAFRTREPGTNFYLVLMLSLGITVMGLIDDVLHLGIVSRIGSQLLIVAGTLFLLGVPAIPMFGLILSPGLASYLLVALALIWFINLFNFMDGIDANAASETIFISIGILLVTFAADSGILKIMLPVLVATLGGFLVFNIPPARIFMGDAGSNFLGYLLGLVCLLSTTTGITNIWVWGILAGVFVVDASYTLIARMVKGETWYHAHRTHAYQLAALHWDSHGRVVGSILLINCCWLLPLAWIADRFPQWGLVLTVIAWLPLILLVKYIGSRGIPGQHSVPESRG